MEKNVLKNTRRVRRKRAIRKRIFGTPDQPRLSVYRSNNNIYAQVINDVAGHTIAASTSAKIEKGWTEDAAKAVGKEVAEKAKSAGVEAVSFDRSGYRYHGRIKALADAAREAGLKF